MHPAPSRESLASLLRRIAPFVAPFRAGLAVAFLLATSTAALSACEPLVLKSIFDALAARAPLSALGARGAVLVGVLLVHEGLSALLDWVVWRVRIGLDYGLLAATIDRLHALPLSFHRKQTVGALMTKVERGIAGTVTAFSGVAFSLLPSIVYLVMAVVVMLRLEWRLGLLVLAFAPLPAAIGALASGEQVARERSLLERWTKLFSRFNEVLAGMIVVKSFVMEDAEKRRFLRRVRAANRHVVRGVATDARTNGIKNGVVALARFAAIGYGAYLVSQDRMAIGTLVAFMGYVAGVFQPVQSLTGVYQTLRKGRVALEVVFSILGEEDALPDAPDAREPGRVRGWIELADVSFAYRDGASVLDRVSFAVRPGETVALVGPSGGGKTTIAALLQRLYDPTAGSVRIDGVDVRALKQRGLRQQVGVVLQEGLLFSDTIRANIAFGRPGATMAEIEAAARAANAHEFILRLKEGYDTLVGERGGTLSGGERQRIAIARALLKDAPILVLDEATSALDTESEAKVQEALARLVRGRTTIVIAHRLATVAHADRILVLEGGRVVESGTHAELLDLRGAYAALVKRQANLTSRDAA